MPALCAATLLLLPVLLARAGAGEPIAPPRIEVDVAPGSVTLEADAATGRIAPSRLVVQGFRAVQLSEAGLPRAWAAPVWWTPRVEAEVWPVAFEAELPTDGGVLLVAWLDVDGSGRLDVGDRCSAPTAVAPDRSVTLRLDRGYVTPGAPPSTTVDFAPTLPAALAVERAGLVVLGFAATDLGPSGFPRPQVRPAFAWAQPPRTVSWPVRAAVPLPDDPGLRIFGIVDVDGDGRLSPGDHLALPDGPLRQPAGPDEPVVFVVDQTLPSRSGGPPGGEPGGGGCGGR
jgi:hypothetical protein